MAELRPPFVADPATLRAGTPFVGQNTVAAEPNIQNDGWFPPVSPGKFRSIRQFDNTHASEAVIDALTLAMHSVNDDAREWKIANQEAGYTSLSEFDDAEAKAFYYQTAVFSTAVAILNHRNWAVADSAGKNSTAANTAWRESLIESADEYQRERWEALQLLRGEPRTISGAL